MPVKTAYVLLGSFLISNVRCCYIIRFLSRVSKVLLKPSHARCSFPVGGVLFK
ncbi:hypothetical protein SLEP1_g11660 [Rubroshorea leprosula]|nr:hypothetical protein SLEP1_g11660 [Rubroshorea leprosula]